MRGCRSWLGFAVRSDLNPSPCPLPFRGEDSYIVSTTRKRALPLIMRFAARRRASSGKRSVIGRTPICAANASASAESIEVPEDQPATERRRDQGERRICIGSVGRRDDEPALDAEPPDDGAPWPSASGAVARITRAPPSFGAPRPASSRLAVDVAARPSSFANASLSAPRAIATTSKPIAFAAYCTPRWPRPPRPSTATRSPERAPRFRSALNVVTPAQSSGAASANAERLGQCARPRRRARPANSA